MAKFSESLSGEIISFIEAQKMFFTGTAPAAGRVNVSPKGMDTFKVLSPTKVAYLDLTGSGNETAGHIKENSRLTIMFCSFDEKPLILRLYGEGEVVKPDDVEWKELFSHFPDIPGARQIIVLNVQSTQSSCGFAVPFYEFKGERDVLANWAQKKGDNALEEYREKNNKVTIDGKNTGYI